MKQEQLSCEKARNISIVPTLGKLGHFPKRQTDKEAWFLSPFRQETQASFKVSKQLNRWYDHGEGFGGNVIDLIIRLQKCTIKEALHYLNENFNFSFHQPQKFNSNEIENSKQYEILRVKKIENKALLDYLNSRYIEIEIAKEFCNEIYYQINGKTYFAIAFKNDTNGYEIRNKYFKGCIGNKSITHIKKGTSKVVLFEGFLDFLSYKTLFKNESLDEDYLIFNSVSLIHKTSFSKQYVHVHTYMDNDEAGRKATSFLKEQYHHLIDCSYFYKQQKDINQYLMENYKV